VLRLRAVTVDFWGTLILDPPSSDDRYRRRRLADFETVLAGAGVRVSQTELDRAYEASSSFLGRLWSQNKDVPAIEHVRAILAAVDPRLPERLTAEALAALLDAYARPALLVPPAVDTGARRALERLRERGLVLAVLSNTMRTPGATLCKLLDRFGLLGCFARTIFSDEVGVRKPSPEIFALTLRALQVEPAATIHVGDDPVLDVGGAQDAGIRVIQVTSASRKSLGPQRPDAVVPSLAALPEAISSLDEL
jgi:putative hydrolase of the HAD superfamily